MTITLDIIITQCQIREIKINKFLVIESILRVSSISPEKFYSSTMFWRNAMFKRFENIFDYYSLLWNKDWAFIVYLLHVLAETAKYVSRLNG